MLKRTKKIISFITSAAIACSLSTAISSENYYEPSEQDQEQESVKLDYERIEELPDGGKIYVYIIDGVENSFPVPPEDFKPLTATDEQLEIYGFPPRPDRENQEEYNQWAELMSNYKYTKAPELEVAIKHDEESISTLSFTGDTRDPKGTYVAGDTSDPKGACVAGYTSTTSGSKFYTMIQADMVYPKVTTKETKAKCSFWIGMGRASYKKAVCAGFTTEVQKSQAQKNKAWYGYREENRKYKTEFNITDFAVNAGDNLHIYFSYQKSSNKLNYYFANNTTGQTSSALVDIHTGVYFDGSKASWVIEQLCNLSGIPYKLADFGSVTFKNCKAMLSNSSTWTNLGSLENISANKMCTGEGDPGGVVLGSIVYGNQFSCRWNFSH